MTQIEQIKAEIERLGNNWDGFKEGTLFQADLRELLSFIENLEKERFKLEEEAEECLQQEQPKDLASLINEATNVAKRIVDRDSFYNSLPQNLRYKYTFEAWCKILEALSTMKGQKQPEVDLEKELEQYARNHPADDAASYRNLIGIARHFYELGINGRRFITEQG